VANLQPPEAPSKQDGSSLDVHSVFFTVQGEGPFSGHRAVFVRLAGCNLQCPGCDTEYTRGRRQVNIYDLADEVRALACFPDPRPVVVITGGEPLRQPIGWFVRLMRQHGYPVQIESNGTCAPDETLLDLMLRQKGTLPHHHNLHLVVSPKTASIHPICHLWATAFKYVVDERHVGDDGLPNMALDYAKAKGVARPRPGAPVYLTPYDTPYVPGQGFAQAEEQDARNRSAVAASAMKHGYIAGLQIHKLMEVP
jgi:organic radical activating enzyme